MQSEAGEEAVDHHGPAREPLVIDITGGLFRGSGAMFQTDRLTIGRTGNKYLVKGADQVVEKVVFKEDKQSQERVTFLEAQLREIVFKYALVSAECERLTLRGSVMPNHTDAESTIRSFQNLLADREAELVTLRSAKTHESSDSSVRIAILAQENQRLQKSSQSLSSRIVSMEHQVQKLESDSIFKPENMARIPIVADLAKMLEARDSDLALATDKITSLQSLLSEKMETLKNSEGRNLRLEQGNRAKDKEIIDLKSKLQNLEKQAILQASQSSEQTSKLRQNMEVLEQEVARLKISESNLSKRLSEAAKELEETKNSLSVVGQWTHPQVNAMAVRAEQLEVELVATSANLEAEKRRVEA